MTIRTDVYQAPIQDFIQPVLTEVTAQLQTILPNMHSLYLYGSAASGKAINGKSDLDLTLVLTTELTEIQQQQLNSLKYHLVDKYKTVSKIDFDCGLLDEILNEKSLYRWGSWLKHYCQWVDGDNLRLHFPVFKPSRQLAIAINLGYAQLIQDDLALLEATTSANTKILLKNQICKRLIRASNIKRPLEEQQWPFQLEEYIQLFSRWYPNLSTDIHYFYSLLKHVTFSTEQLKNKAFLFMDFLSS